MELDRTTEVWNGHVIRVSRRGLPSGRPNIMMEAPFLYGTRSYLNNITQQEIDDSKNICEFRKAIPCDEDMYNLCCNSMRENNLDYPNSCEEAIQLYFTLRVLIRNQLGV